MGIDFYVKNNSRAYTNREIAQIITIVTGITVKSRDIGRYRRFVQKRPVIDYTKYSRHQAETEAGWYRKLFSIPALAACDMAVGRNNGSVCIGRGYQIPDSYDYYDSTKRKEEILEVLINRFGWSENTMTLLSLIDEMYWG